MFERMKLKDLLKITKMLYRLTFYMGEDTIINIKENSVIEFILDNKKWELRLTRLE